MREANSLDQMLAFVNGLRVNWATDPPEVSLPAIMPPLAMKPILCTEYLDRWFTCGQMIRKAKTIVIVGYSFGIADEHFNDLVRKGSQEAKVIVVDPSLESVITRVCHIVRQDKTALRPVNIRGLECKAGRRLVFVKAKAEELSATRLKGLLD